VSRWHDAVTLGLVALGAVVAVLVAVLLADLGRGALTGQVATPTPGVVIRRVPIDDDGVTCYARGEALSCVKTSGGTK